MAKLSIVTYPAKILKRKAGMVPPSAEIEKLVPQMIEAMYTNEGIGLAAPQIGISKRIIIVGPEKPQAFLNPQIIKKSKETQTEEEGCLSLPGIFGQVKRAQNVELVCQTPRGETIKVEAAGLTAKIFQHEIDHLNGKLIIDRIGLWKRFKLRKQLKELARHAHGTT